jgi:hypothetical protein
MHDRPPALDLARRFAQLIVGSEGVEKDRVVYIATAHDAESFDPRAGRNLLNTDLGLPLSGSHSPSAPILPLPGRPIPNPLAFTTPPQCGRG